MQGKWYNIDVVELDRVPFSCCASVIRKDTETGPLVFFKNNNAPTGNRGNIGL